MCTLFEPPISATRMQILFSLYERKTFSIKSDMFCTRGILSVRDARDKLRQADSLIAAVRGVFITAGYVHGARIMNDVSGSRLMRWTLVGDSAVIFFGGRRGGSCTIQIQRLPVVRSRRCALGHVAQCRRRCDRSFAIATTSRAATLSPTPQLYGAGKYGEAIRPAERYAAATAAR